MHFVLNHKNHATNFETDTGLGWPLNLQIAINMQYAWLSERLREYSNCGCAQYSWIPLSRASLTRENQLVALAPSTPNFSDAPLATTHMTDPVTHMCWSEQISPLAHSSQATWRAFNLSHCIEMHNTHPLGHAGQLSQTFFTHSAPILTPHDQPPTVNKQWLPLRESCMSRYTRFNTSRKRKLPRCTVYFSVQIQFTDRYDHQSEFDLVFLLCRNLSYLKCDLRICHWEAHYNFGETWLRIPEDISVLCQGTTWFGWCQHRIHHVLPYATCDLTVL